MKISHLILMVLLSVMIVGCGGGGDSSTSSDPVTNSDGLPPDPGDAGKVNLEGIDSDSDGVRDDVQIAIHNRYPNDVGKRAALEQNAKAIQEAVVAGNASNISEIHQVTKLLDQALYCIYERIGIENSSPETSFIEQQVINTSNRNEAYVKFNEALSGQFFGDGDINTENPCE